MDGLLLHLVVDVSNDFGEVGWTVQWVRLESAFVGIDYSLYAIDLWTTQITIQGEAVGSFTINETAIAVDINLLVAIVVLQDLAYASDGLYVLVAFWIKVMKRARPAGVPIGASEVHCNR